MSNLKTLTTTACALHVRVIELESFVQSFARVIQFHAFDIRQALRIDQHRHAVTYELQIIVAASSANSSL